MSANFAGLESDGDSCYDRSTDEEETEEYPPYFDVAIKTEVDEYAVAPSCDGPIIKTEGGNGHDDRSSIPEIVSSPIVNNMNADENNAPHGVPTRSEEDDKPEDDDEYDPAMIDYDESGKTAFCCQNCQ